MNVTNNISVTGNGVTIQRTIQRSVEGASAREISLPAAKAGTLSTRTSTSVGTLTLSPGHGITTGMTVDLYWTGGNRYTVTVGTVSGDSVPFSLGAGFDLPVQGTAVTICEEKQVNLAIDGTRLSLLAIEVGYANPAETAASILRFDDAAASPLAQLYLSGNLPVVMDVTSNNGNSVPGYIAPFSDVSDKLFVTHASAATATLRIVWGVDATP